jgi:hypothetical protein
MNESTQQNLRFTQKTQESRYVIVANIFESKSRQTIKIIDLSGHLLGIALRDEILDLLAGYRDHVNVVLFRIPLEVKTADPDKITIGEPKP